MALAKTFSLWIVFFFSLNDRHWLSGEEAHEIEMVCGAHSKILLAVASNQLVPRINNAPLGTYGVLANTASSDR